jgi:hypothetical protein
MIRTKASSSCTPIAGLNSRQKFRLAMSAPFAEENSRHALSGAKEVCAAGRPAREGGVAHASDLHRRVR